MSTPTNIKRAMTRLLNKLTKEGKSSDFINQAMSINFPSYYQSAVPTVMHTITTTVDYQDEPWGTVFKTATGALKAIVEELGHIIEAFDGEIDEEKVELYEGPSLKHSTLTINELADKTLENGKSCRVVFHCYEFHISTVGVGE